MSVSENVVEVEDTKRHANCPHFDTFLSRVIWQRKKRPYSKNDLQLENKLQVGNEMSRENDSRFFGVRWVKLFKSSLTLNNCN